MRAEGGPSHPFRYADVVITHFVASQHDRITAPGPGVAAAREERRPRKGGLAVLLVPLAVETCLAQGRSEQLDATRGASGNDDFNLL